MDWEAASSRAPDTIGCRSLRTLPDAPPYGRELLQSLGLPGVQFGSLNRLHRACLNVDLCRAVDAMGAASVPGRLCQLDGRGHYLQADATRPLPVAGAAFEWAYSEHFIEHLAQADAIAWLREVRRLVRPGGLVRVTTPDLRRYVEGYLAGDDAFFAEHRRRLTGMGLPGAPARPAWMVNQLFRFWGHRWIYDVAELRHVAAEAGFDPAGLEERGYRQGRDPSVCKLDQEARSDESLYVELTV